MPASPISPSQGSPRSPAPAPDRPKTNLAESRRPGGRELAADWPSDAGPRSPRRPRAGHMSRSRAGSNGGSWAGRWEPSAIRLADRLFACEGTPAPRVGFHPFLNPRRLRTTCKIGDPRRRGVAASGGVTGSVGCPGSASGGSGDKSRATPDRRSHTCSEARDRREPDRPGLAEPGDGGCLLRRCPAGASADPPPDRHRTVLAARRHRACAHGALGFPDVARRGRRGGRGQSHATSAISSDSGGAGDFRHAGGRRRRRGDARCLLARAGQVFRETLRPHDRDREVHQPAGPGVAGRGGDARSADRPPPD